MRLADAVDRGFGNPQVMKTADPFLASLRDDSRSPGLVAEARQNQASIAG
jgi:hypothetical protein